MSRFEEYLKIFNENQEKEDEGNFLFKNKKFISDFADTAFINVGFVKKNLSTLEQGSLIAGELEYLNRFKNFKNFLGDPELSVEPTNDGSISSYIKREIERCNDILNNSRITQYNKKLFTMKKEKAIQALKNIEDLISILNVSFAKMKKIRKKNTLMKKVKTFISKKNEPIKEKDEIFENIRRSIINLEPKIQYMDFSIFLSELSKLRIIESSMGHKN